MRTCVHALVATGVAACSLDAGGDDSDPGPDPVYEAREIVEYAGGFAGQLEYGRYDSQGRIEPVAYAYYGLHARGYLGQAVTSTSTYLDLEATLGPPTGERNRFRLQDYGTGRPRGLGLGQDEDFTIVVDGFIELSAGTTTLALIADDVGFAELDLLNGETVTVRSAGGIPGTAAVIEVPGPGWYPIRGAMSDATGDARFILQRDGEALRARSLKVETSTQDGLEVVGASATALSRGEVTLGKTIFGPPLGSNPNDLGLTAPYALRLRGEVWLETAGIYRLALDFGDSVPVPYRIGSEFSGQEDRWAGPIDIGVPGWQPIRIELTEVQPDTTIRLVAIRDGDAPIALDQFRPNDRRVEEDSLYPTAGPATPEPFLTTLTFRADHAIASLMEQPMKCAVAVYAPPGAAALFRMPDDRIAALENPGTTYIGDCPPLDQESILELTNTTPDDLPDAFVFVLTAETNMAVSLPVIYTSPPFATPGAHRPSELIPYDGVDPPYLPPYEVRSAPSVGRLHEIPWRNAYLTDLDEVTQYRVALPPRPIHALAFRYSARAVE